MRNLLRAVAVATLGAAAIMPTATAGATTPPLVAVIGDSYTAGTGSACGCQTQAWFQFTAADMGWQVGNVVADPGAGYVQPGSYGTLATALRAHPIPANTNYVLVQGGLNDSNAAASTIPAAVNDLLAVVHAQAPNAVPIVVGAVDPVADDFYGTHQVAVARAIGDYRGIGATRYTIAFAAGFQVGPDAVHPTTLGHQQLGHWVSWHLQNGLDNGRPLTWHPELGYWAA